MKIHFNLGDERALRYCEAGNDLGCGVGERGWNGFVEIASKLTSCS